jgi:SPP1 family predicted phage head-tail adaptor
MSSGKLSSRIDVYGKVKKANILNEKYYQDDKISSIWAEVIPQTGSMTNRSADTILTNVTHKIRVRYNAGKNIKASFFIMCKEKRYDIKFILNPYNKNEWLEIFCEEIIE